MTSRNPFASALAFLPLAFVAGCFEQVDSNEVTTRSMHATVELTSTDGVATHVSTMLAVGGRLGTGVLLANGDRLVASARGRSTTLTPGQDHWGNVVYEGLLPEGGENVVVTLDYLRGDTSAQAQSCGNTSAMGTYAYLPRPFEFAPMMQTARLGSATTTLAWSNVAPGRIAIEVSGTCIQGGMDSVLDAGSFTLPAAWLSASDPRSPLACTVYVAARRCNAGQVSSEFGEGGTVEACQSRTMSFRVSP